MGEEYTEIDERIQRWMERQQMFFVSTAPMLGDGHVNCSPKGLDSLQVANPRQLVYADVGGSGIETVAHLKDNGRITIMMCAFSGPPRIYRFFGKGEVIEPHDERFSGLAQGFSQLPAIRNIIVIDVKKIMDSCGYGVPLYDFKKHRDSFDNYFRDKTDQQILQYRRDRNAKSLDGLIGLEVGKIADTD